jgi:hypothetical protein
MSDAVHTLIAFDVDGTLDTSKGPVPWAHVLRLAASPGIVCGIVSPSKAWPANKEHAVRAYLVKDQNLISRRDSLLLFFSRFPDVRLKLYVSDNRDHADARAAGFAYVDAWQFSWGLV